MQPCIWVDFFDTFVVGCVASVGQGMVEYALILVLIAVVVIVLLIVLGNQVANVFCNISGAIGQ